jgi:hypothetical protein
VVAAVGVSLRHSSLMGNGVPAIAGPIDAYAKHVPCRSRSSLRIHAFGHGTDIPAARTAYWAGRGRVGRPDRAAGARAFRHFTAGRCAGAGRVRADVGACQLAQGVCHFAQRFSRLRDSVPRCWTRLVALGDSSGVPWRRRWALMARQAGLPWRAGGYVWTAWRSARRLHGAGMLASIAVRAGRPYDDERIKLETENLW